MLWSLGFASKQGRGLSGGGGVGEGGGRPAGCELSIFEAARGALRACDVIRFRMV